MEQYQAAASSAIKRPDRSGLAVREVIHRGIILKMETSDVGGVGIEARRSQKAESDKVAHKIEVLVQIINHDSIKHQATSHLLS